MQELLTKELILKAQARRYKNIEIPELGGTLRVSSLSAARLLDYRKLEARRAKGEEIELEMIAYTIAHGCVDGVGRPLFDDAGAAAVLDLVGYEIALQIFHEVVDLTSGGKKPKGDGAPAEAPGGNSEASPSGA